MIFSVIQKVTKMLQNQKTKNETSIGSKDY